MKKNMKLKDSVILTIPGSVYINGEIILDEISDIHHFSTKKNKLLSYIYLNSSVYRSVNFQTRKNRMFKCESKVLKYALVNAFHNVVKTMPPSRLTMISNWLKIGTTIMSLCTMPANSLESSRKR